MTDDTDERGEEYVAQQRGGDHLPECPTSDAGYLYGICICDRLRACEARVRKTAYNYERGLAEGRRYALRQARDAVSALPWKRWRAFGPADHEAFVLAAIDALRATS